MLKTARLESPGFVILILEGDIVMENEAVFRKKIDELDKSTSLPIVIDMHKVDFVDSWGLGALINILSDFKSRGRRVHIHRPENPNVELVVSHFINT